MNGTDTYFSIERECDSQFVEQRSRFISFSFSVTDATQVKERVAFVQKEYFDARHVCYAYVLGADRNEWRANDNGEPSGTAGKPILGQINSRNLTDVLVVVVRYFGGVKLGTSGLAEAYRRAASDVLELSGSSERYVESSITVLFSYQMMNTVMKIVKDINPKIVSQEYGSFTAVEGDSAVYECRMVFRARMTETEELRLRLCKCAEIRPVPEIVCI